MRYRTLLVTMALGLAVSFGPAMAGGPDGGSAGREVGKISFIDRAANIVQLTNGTELHTMDPRMLANLKEGMRVLVDFVHTEDDRNELNSITPVAPGAAVDAPEASAFGE
jgi:hypothetical protein